MPFKIYKLFVTVVTFSDIFIQDIKDFLALIFLVKICFCLKNKIMHTFWLGFVFIDTPIAGSVFSEKNMSFSLFYC